MSDEKKWTPGPWEVATGAVDHQREIVVAGEPRITVGIRVGPRYWGSGHPEPVHYTTHYTPERVEANARCAAAAPEMYEALVVVEDHIEDCAATTHGTPCKDKAPCGPCAAKRLVRAALAKAAREEQKP